MQELIESNGQRIGPRKLVICNWLPVLFGYHLTAPCHTSRRTFWTLVFSFFKQAR